MANYELKKIQWLKAAGLTSSSPKDPHYMKVLNRGNPITDARPALAGQTLASTMNARQTPNSPDKIWHASANTLSVASTSGHWANYPIHLSTILTENCDMKPEDSIVMNTKLNIPSPEEYSGTSALELYEIFVTGVLQWLRLNSLLGEDNADFQVEYLGTRLNGDALEWYTQNVERLDQPIKDWSLEAVIEGLQKYFWNTLTHRQVSNKFDTIEQGKCTVQEVHQDLTKYAVHMVQYPNEYSCKR